MQEQEKNFESEVKIDRSTHKPVPTTSERIKYALTSLGFGFLLVQIIGFWMFPGPGIGGLYMFSSSHHLVSSVGSLTTVIISAFLAICLVAGWFRGKYFIDRLKGYINFWKFW
ncbi:MAG: hypothetical protein R3222_00845 [Balneolaceae bacterium]|nr:hypothetical protein [Balneolaceae bacterium]